MEEVKEQVISLPRLGEPAPAFEATTTHGVLKLEDFKGSWLILFSHPADFTPVCTTEFIAFAEIYPERTTKARSGASRIECRQCLFTHCLGAQCRGENRSKDTIPYYR